MKLLINIGNTNTWICLYSGRKKITDLHIPTHTTDYDTIITDELLDVDEVIISSLVPHRYESLLQTIKKIKDLPIVLLDATRSTQLNDGGYDLKKLGTDRMLILESAISKYGTNILVCDLGTASTLNYVDSNQVLAGGFILPGIDMSLTALHNKTGLLQKTSKEGAVSLQAHDTAGNIRSGVLLSLVYTIERYAKEYTAQIILTGGNSELIAPYFQQDVVVDTNLLMEGMVEIIAQSKDKNNGSF